MPGTRKLLVILLLCGLAAGCGGDDAAVDFTVRGVGVRVETGAAFAHEDAFPARVEAVVGAALAYWGGGWDQLAGRRLTLSAGPYVACGSEGAASGCWDGNLRVSTWDPGVGTVSCVEQTVLVHEIGHAVIGDRMHEDPRWMEFDPVAAALVGATGWGPDGATTCEIAVSVWRHPLGAP